VIGLLSRGLTGCTISSHFSNTPSPQSSNTPHTTDRFYANFDIFEASLLPKSVVWSVLGEVYRVQGNFTEAAKAFQNAVELERNNSRLRSVIREFEKSIVSSSVPDCPVKSVNERSRDLLPEAVKALLMRRGDGLG
jgi:Tetratricopeptide repeat